MTVYRLDTNGRATVIQSVKAREGARTAAYDAKADRLYLLSARIERDAAGACPCRAALQDACGW